MDTSKLSAEKATEDLRTYPERFNTKESLRELARGMSVDTPGNVTMLYSGAANDNVSANQLAVTLARQDKNVRIIDKTEVARLLTSAEYIKAVADVHGTTPQKMREDRSNPGNQFLYDGKDGVWAETSKRFVSNTRTEVVTATPYAPGDRVFAQVELREALKNKEIHSINGVPKEVFQHIHKTTGSLEEVNKAVAASSFERMQAMKAAVTVVDAGGKKLSNVAAVEPADFLGRPSVAPPVANRADLAPVLDSGKEAGFAEGRRLLEQARAALKLEERKTELPRADADPAAALSKARAQAFAHKPAADAVKEYPELAGAYAAVAAMDKRVQTDRLTPQQQAEVSARIRENVTKSIEQGELPQVQVREQREVKREAEPQQARSR